MINQYLCSCNGVFVKDTQSGEILLSHNCDSPFPAASVIKLFILSFYAGAEDKMIPVTRKDYMGTSVISELKLKEVSLYDALTYMIAFSDNTAANLLIKEGGMENINGHIKSIGCENTVLARKMMDFASREKGIDNFTTLEDCFKVMQRLSDDSRSMEILSLQKCRDRLGRYIFRNAQLYLKGGDLNDVYNDVGILITPEGKRIFAGVLTHGYDRSKAKRLCGLAGLLACGKQLPIV